MRRATLAAYLLVNYNTHMASSKLKHRIPPPVVTSVSALIMWALAQLFPQAVAAESSSALAVIFSAVGLIFAGAGIAAFAQQKTTVNPVDLQRTTALVTHGIYRVTRNPMYVGLLFLLFGWALYLANILSMLWLAPWVVYMSHMQIAPEERAMETLFGDEYRAYCQQVRRWL